jgi:hypothetical protein
MLGRQELQLPQVLQPVKANIMAAIAKFLFLIIVLL